MTRRAFATALAIGLPISASWMLARWADAFRPRARMQTPDWCEAHLRLPAAFGATPGKYDLTNYSFWREPLQAVDDPECEKISIMAATQVGKTEFVKAALCAQSVVDPAPAMIAGPDKDYVGELRDKIYAMGEATAALRDGLPPKHLRNYRWIDFGGSYCYLAWSGSPQRLSGKSCKRVWCSEIDRWSQSPHEGKTQELVAERVKAFLRYKIVYESTPTDQSSTIASLYRESDARKYHVPCPKCGHYQELRFFPHREGPYKGKGFVAGLKDEAGEWRSSDEVLETAYYMCEMGCRIESHEKTAMVARGIWCPAGQKVNKRGRLTGTPKRSGRVRGYQLSSLYAPSISFGRFAAKYVDSREDTSSLRSFWNNWLGLPYSVQTSLPLWRELGRKLAGGYVRGSLPAAALFLTAGADVQDDRCYWVVRGWGQGCTSWLVDFGVCGKRIDGVGGVVQNSDLEQLETLVLGRYWPLVSPNRAGLDQLSVRLQAIDVNFQSARVWEWVRNQAGDRVRAVAGDHRMDSSFYTMTTVEKNARTGKPYPGGMQRWGINVDTYKTDIQGRWKSPSSQAGAWFVFDNALEEAESYLRQVTNEGPVYETNSRGRQVKTWQVLNPRLGNHWWDCEVYARAAADMVCGGDWENLEVPADGQRRTTVISSGVRRPDGSAW